MALTREEVQHIARLARLELTPQEEELYTQQLTSILDFINQLQLVDTSGLEPTSQVTGLVNRYREDKVAPCADREALLASVPFKTTDGGVKVKAVF